MTLSGSGLNVDGISITTGAINCGSLTSTGAKNCWSLTTAGVINCGSLSSINAVSCRTISCSGYAGIGVLSPAYRCHIKTHLNDLDNSFHLDAGNIGDPNKYSLTIWAFSDGPKVGWKFRTCSLEGRINAPLLFDHAGNVGMGTDYPLSKCHIYGKLVVNSGNTQTGPPINGDVGGFGDRIVMWYGAASSNPFSLGIDDSTLWYSAPSACFHKFYVWRNVIANINGTGLAIGSATALFPLYVFNGGLYYCFN